MVEILSPSTLLEPVQDLSAMGSSQICVGINLPEEPLTLGTKPTDREIAQMMQLLGVSIRAGVPILDVFGATAEFTPNVHLRRLLAEAEQLLTQGADLATGFALSNQKLKILPTGALQMIQQGEMNGDLDFAFLLLARYFDKNPVAALFGWNPETDNSYHFVRAFCAALRWQSENSEIDYRSALLEAAQIVGGEPAKRVDMFLREIPYPESAMSFFLEHQDRFGPSFAKKMGLITMLGIELEAFFYLGD